MMTMMMIVKYLCVVLILQNAAAVYGLICKQYNSFSEKEDKGTIWVGEAPKEDVRCEEYNFDKDCKKPISQLEQDIENIMNPKLHGSLYQSRQFFDSSNFPGGYERNAYSCVLVGINVNVPIGSSGGNATENHYLIYRDVYKGNLDHSPENCKEKTPYNVTVGGEVKAIGEKWVCACNSDYCNIANPPPLAANVSEVLEKFRLDSQCDKFEKCGCNCTTLIDKKDYIILDKGKEKRNRFGAATKLRSEMFGRGILSPFYIVIMMMLAWEFLFAIGT